MQVKCCSLLEEKQTTLSEQGIVHGLNQHGTYPKGAISVLAESRLAMAISRAAGDSRCVVGSIECGSQQEPGARSWCFLLRQNSAQ